MTRQSSTTVTMMETGTEEVSQFETVLRKVVGVATSEYSDEIDTVCTAAGDEDKLRNSAFLLLYRLADDYSSASDSNASAMNDNDNVPPSSSLKYLYRSTSRTLDFLFRTFTRSRDEAHNAVWPEQEKCAFNAVCEACTLVTCLLIEGAFSAREQSNSSADCLLRAVLADELPRGFLERLVICAYEQALDSSINAYFDAIGRALSRVSCLSTIEEHVPVIEALQNLLSIKVPDTKPPLSLRDDFAPSTSGASPTDVVVSSGRELMVRSYLGPLLKLSLGDGQSTELDAYFSSYDVEAVPPATLQLVFENLRSKLTRVRAISHKIVKELASNAKSRQRTLDWIESTITMNWKRAQIRADMMKLADDGSMCNLLSVLYEMSAPITLDKVQSNYVFHEKSRIRSTLKDETRMLMTPDELKEYEESLTDRNFNAKFTTECFFLTVHCQHIAIQPMLQHVKSMRHQLGRMLSQIRTAQAEHDAETDVGKRATLAANVAKLKRMRDRLVRYKWSQETLLGDGLFLQNALQFCLKQLRVLVSIIAPNYYNGNTPLPEEAPPAARALPEFYIEDVLDILVHMITVQPQLLITMGEVNDCMHAILVFIVSPQHFKNVFLASKSVELLSRFAPSVQPAATHVFNATIQQQIARERLFPALVVLYSRIETTGAHTEFFDKFEMRHQINTIMMHLREDASYRQIIIDYARKSDDDFVRFINMIINDLTFFLDESMQALRAIHEYEKWMAEPDHMETTTEEQRSFRRGVYMEKEGAARSWLWSARQTLRMIDFLTKDCPRPFLGDDIGKRLAIMLNYNLQLMCGQSCQELRVANKEKYDWDPRALVRQLVAIYINLNTQKFATYIAQDERSYSKETMDVVMERIRRNGLVPQTQMEPLQWLFDKAYEYWSEYVKEDDTYDDAPEEFLDLLLGTIMKDPVLLPTSGKICDRQVIERCLLSDELDPFNRAPLTKEQLVPQEELRVRIEQWKAERRAAKAAAADPC